MYLIDAPNTWNREERQEAIDLASERLRRQDTELSREDSEALATTMVEEAEADGSSEEHSGVKVRVGEREGRPAAEEAPEAEQAAAASGAGNGGSAEGEGEGEGEAAEGSERAEREEAKAAG